MRFLTFCSALCLIGSGAAAITINPGELWRGNISFGPENLNTSPCCPVVDGTLEFNGLQQFGLFTGLMEIGTTFTVELFEPNGTIYSSLTWGPRNQSHNGGIGIGLGDVFGAEPPAFDAAIFEISVAGAAVDFDPDASVIYAVYDADVQTPNSGIVSTNLVSFNPVTDLALVTSGPVDPVDPIDPVTPAPVPLPSAGWLLAFASAALAGLRRPSRA